MAVINKGSFPALLQEGLNSVFGLEAKQYPEEWRPLYEFNTSKKSREEDVLVTRMGLVPVMQEGEGVQYDSMKQAYKSIYEHDGYGKGFIITHQEMMDNLYLSVGTMRARALAFSFVQTKNYKGAYLFNNAFDSSVIKGGDGKAFIATDHPTQTGNQSNRITVSSDLSEKALEDILLQVYDTRDDVNNILAYQEEFLLIPSALQFEAERLLKNPNRPETSDRDINALYNMGKFPKGFVVNHFLMEPKAWFVKTNCMDSTKYFEREALQFSQDGDFDTMNVKYKGFERYSFYFSNFRGWYASPGA